MTTGFDRFELNARRDAMATALTKASVARKEAEAVERAAKFEYDSACIEVGRANPVGIVEPPRCLSRREGDEWTCPTCRLRWDVGEERPACLAT